MTAEARTVDRVVAIHTTVDSVDAAADIFVSIWQGRRVNTSGIILV